MSYVDGNIQVKRRAFALVEGSTIDGDLQVEERGASLEARGNFQVFKNSGGVELVSNWIRQNLQCKENCPAPFGGGNVAGEKEDQCARL